MKTARPLVAVASALLLALLAPACASSTDDDSAPKQTEDLGETAQPISAADAVSRARQWVNAGLLYCGAPNHTYDGAICNYTCNRTDVAAWNPYRSDCRSETILLAPQVQVTTTQSIRSGTHRRSPRSRTRSSAV